MTETITRITHSHIYVLDRTPLALQTEKKLRMAERSENIESGMFQELGGWPIRANLL